MRGKIFGGTTSYSAPIYVVNSSTGAGLGSLVFNTSGLVGEYRRQGQASWTSIALTTGTLGSLPSGGWIADGSLTGAYEVGIPNAALAAGVAWVEVRYYGAANMSPVLLYIELDSVNYQSATAFVTSVPTVADKAGYSLSQGFPANFSSLAISGGAVSINQADLVAISDGSDRTIGGVFNAALAWAAGNLSWVGSVQTLANTDGTTFQAWTINVAAPTSGAPTSRTRI